MTRYGISNIDGNRMNHPQWPTENCWRKLRISVEGGAEITIEGVLNLEYSVWSRSSSTVIIADKPQPTSEDSPSTKTDNNFAGYDIGPQPLDGDRPTGNKFTDLDTDQPVSSPYVWPLSYSSRSEHLFTLKNKWMYLTSDIVFFLSLYVFRLWTTIKYARRLNI